MPSIKHSIGDCLQRWCLVHGRSKRIRILRGSQNNYNWIFGAAAYPMHFKNEEYNYIIWAAYSSFCYLTLYIFKFIVISKVSDTIRCKLS